MGVRSACWESRQRTTGDVIQTAIRSVSEYAHSQKREIK